MKTPVKKQCVHCKKEIDYKDDEYEEMRYSYETEEEPEVTHIGLVYICIDCIDLDFDIVEENESDGNEY